MAEYCLLCDDPRSSSRGLQNVIADEITCPRCGKYQTAALAELEIKALDVSTRAFISAWIQERNLRGLNVPRIATSNYEKKPGEAGTFRINDILAMYGPKSVSERLDRTLINLGILSDEPGSKIRITNDNVFACYSYNAGQMLFYLQALQAKGWVEAPAAVAGDLKITVDGWDRISQLQGPGGASRQIFIAMAFAEQLESAWTDGLEPGVSEGGYEPLRIDKKEHNEKICDQIIIEIRRSIALIADVTCHRQGVYFEAGYALGIGLPVIWSCRRNELDQCHFDTRQFNHVVWDEPADLRKQIANRVKATLV